MQLERERCLYMNYFTKLVPVPEVLVVTLRPGGSRTILIRTLPTRTIANRTIANRTIPV